MSYELDKYRARVTNAEYLDDLRRVAEQLGQPSLTGATYRKFGRFHSTSIARRFGSWPLALGAAGLNVEFQQNVPADAALADLRDVAKRLGKNTLAYRDYEIEGKYSPKPLVRAFGSWNAALRAANLEIGKRAKISDDELFDNIERIWQTLGRQPKYAEIELPLSSISVGTYENRFGSWRKALQAFVGSVATPPKEVSPVEKLVPPIASARQVRTTRRHPNWRLLYLVLRGDNFRCVLCGASPALTPGIKLHVDHIVPWSKGGATCAANLQTCCEQCNIGRSNLGLTENND